MIFLHDVPAHWHPIQACPSLHVVPETETGLLTLKFHHCHTSVFFHPANTYIITLELPLSGHYIYYSYTYFNLKNNYLI